MAVNYTNILTKELTMLENTENEDLENAIVDTELTEEEEKAILAQFEAEDTKQRSIIEEEEKALFKRLEEEDIKEEAKREIERKEREKIQAKITDDKLIKPYELFGLDENSSMKDLKKTYYGMALMVHPDKGGSEDEMDILHKAYLYVKEQIKNRIDNPKSLDELEEEFKYFLKKQEDKPLPKFSEIYEDTNDWIKDFNVKFEEEAAKKFGEPDEYGVKNPYDKNFGYGEFMDKSEIDPENAFEINEDYQKARENPDKPIITFHKELIAYKGYGAYGDFGCNSLSLEGKRVNDFSGKDTSDYMAAFSEPETIEDNRNFNRSKEEMNEEYERLMEEREEF